MQDKVEQLKSDAARFYRAAQQQEEFIALCQEPVGAAIHRRKARECRQAAQAIEAEIRELEQA